MANTSLTITFVMHSKSFRATIATLDKRNRNRNCSGEFSKLKSTLKATLLAIGLMQSPAPVFATPDSYSWCAGFSQGINSQQGLLEKGNFGLQQNDSSAIHQLAVQDGAPASAVKSRFIKGLSESQKCNIAAKGSDEAMECRKTLRICAVKMQHAALSRAD